MRTNNTVLSKFFTQYTLKDLLNKKHFNLYNDIITNYKINFDKKTNGNIISDIYNIISKQYRNEYFYQNTIFNKLLLGVHSLKTTTALRQISIENSKADFIMINGKAIVYEIKSELDSFERLETQIKDYYKAFSNVCVVTCEANYDKIKKILNGTTVGFYILTTNNTLSRKMRQEPIENNLHLEHSAIFKLLHKKEFENILRFVYNRLPKCPQAFYYDECFKLFSQISINKIYTLALKELKNRNQVIFNEFKEIPYELKSLVYFSNMTSNSYKRLNIFLENKFGG